MIIEYRPLRIAPNYSVANCRRVMNNKTGRILTTRMSGYRRIVSLTINKKSVNFSVNELVAQEFTKEELAQ